MHGLSIPALESLIVRDCPSLDLMVMERAEVMMMAMDGDVCVYAAMREGGMVVCLYIYLRLLLDDRNSNSRMLSRLEIWREDLLFRIFSIL